MSVSSLKSFSTLLKESYTYARAHSQQILVPAVAFAVLSVIIELIQYSAVGGTFQTAMKQMGETGVFPLTGTQVGILAVTGCVVILASIAVSFYYWILAIAGGKDIGAVFQQAMDWAWPLVMVHIWTFIRSYAWIPALLFLLSFLLPVMGVSPMFSLLIIPLAFLSFIPVIIRGPLLMAAPVILIREKKEPKASVDASMQRLKGYWGKIVGDMILYWICLVIVMFVVGIVTSVLYNTLGSVLGTPISVLITAIKTTVQQAITAMGFVFVVKLTETIMTSARQ